MASPQLEKGYTRIANEILEHLSFAGINGSEYRILLVVIRKTYGFNKKKDKISISQFEKSTKMKHKQAVRTINSLVSKRILLKEENTYKFNKNWEEWVVSKRTPRVLLDTPPVSYRTPKPVSYRTHTKEKKETSTKETAGSNPADVVKVIDLFKEVNPSYKKWFANITQRSACSRLLEQHGIGKLENVIPFLPVSNKTPYIPCATTPLQLEDKWSMIENAWSRRKNELQAKRPKIIL